MATKKKQGGKRKGSGRKPLPDSERRITLTLYPKKMNVDRLGGIDKVRTLVNDFLEQQ